MKVSTLLAVLALGAMYIWAQGVNRRPAPGTTTPAGRAQVIDGDSLNLGGRQIRLQGIDAPEYQQTCQRAGATYPCGREALQALRRLIADGEVTCTGDELDRYGRLLGTCHVGGQNIAERMVWDGYAVAYGDYHVAEAQARNARRGLWAGTFDMPRDYRIAHPRSAPPTAAQPAPTPVPSDAPRPPPRPSG